LVETDDEGSFSNLDRGESAALSVAQDLDDGVVFLTDDLEAREKAKELGIEVHGSVGVVVLGFKKTELDFEEATSKIRGLAEETEMFITDTVVEEVIRVVKELKE
jgi:predicted nucleic acid-binding protein